jgi:plastocyanin
MNKAIGIGIGVVATIGLVGGAYMFIQSKKTPVKDTVVPLDGSTIIVTDDGFNPDKLTVKKGTVVKFVNADKYYHWPASDPHPSHSFYPEIDPHEPVKPDTTWEVQLDKPGKWGIHDHLAPYIIGTLEVTE